MSYAGVVHFLMKIWEGVSPVLAFMWAGLCWVMFPAAPYQAAAICVCIVIVFDLVTKLFALAKANGGYIEATKRKVIYSDTLWRKTCNKLVAYISIMILAGLAARVCPVADIGEAVATVIYSFIFIRECQSILENLIEAGVKGLDELLGWVNSAFKGLFNKNKEDETDV